nr:BtrH N-terminal domain-containing protein [Candidatus Njordarchaeota archaeon]
MSGPQTSRKVNKPTKKKEKNFLPFANYGEEGVTGEVIDLNDFKHMPGHNCQLCSLRKTLAYHGWDFSEEMLLGLASALGMLYWEMKLMPVPFIGALNAKETEIFERVVTRLGGNIITHQTSSPLKAHQNLKELLKAGEPAITFIDMAFMPYFFREDAEIPFEEAHFGGHTVVVYELDEKNGIVYISDRLDKPLRVPLKYFQMARASLYQPFPPRHKLVELNLPVKPKPLKEVLPGAIEDNLEWMMDPPISNFGLKGYLKFKQQFPTWYKRFDADKFLLALSSTFIYMETGGSGGAWVRCMYSRFLREAAEVLNKPMLNKAADIFDEEIRAIRELELAMLPEELPNLAEIRRTFIETNMVQEKMESNYRHNIRELDDRLKAAIGAAKDDDYTKYRPFILKVQAAIEKVYDLESKAWTQVKSIHM